MTQKGITDMNEAIMENFSKKKTRGRPRSQQREWFESRLKNLFVEGCLRTRMSEVMGMTAFSAVSEASEDDQRLIWGWTKKELEAGRPCPMPKGWKTASVEIGRYIQTMGASCAGVVSLMVGARKRNLPWSDIGAHFRKLRLGEREGNSSSMLMVLSRAVDDYRKRFPKTSSEQVLKAIVNLKGIIEHEMQQRQPATG